MAFPHNLINGLNKEYKGRLSYDLRCFFYTFEWLDLIIMISIYTKQFFCRVEIYLTI
jgi:hypothetical protein